MIYFQFIVWAIILNQTKVSFILNAVFLERYDRFQYTHDNLWYIKYVNTHANLNWLDAIFTYLSNYNFSNLSSIR